MDEARVVGLLQDLIRFDTTNPPGNERPCVDFLEERLRAAGIVTTRYAQDPERPNLVARLEGQGTAPPLLLFGHVDVVTTAHQQWAVPPFEGRLQEGMIWGRGALDMKAGIAMMTAAILEVGERGIQPQGDILLCVLSDEEAGGTLGARFLVEQHPTVFAGVRYALGEFGGFPLHIEGCPTYLIQVAEKQPCWMEVRVHGPGGHGARPMRGGAMAELADLLHRLDTRRLPIHIADATRRMVLAMSNVLPRGKRIVFRRLLNPRWTDRILRGMGEMGRNLEPLFRNTINATVVRGGEKANVIPSEIVLGLDGRLLPGQHPEDLIAELTKLIGRPLDCEILLHDSSSEGLDMGLYDLLSEALLAQAPDAACAPYLLPGSSDARFFSRLGIQTYGFIPMNLPEGFDFFSTIHAADERIPVECLSFGTKAILHVLEHYGIS